MDRRLITATDFSLSQAAKSRILFAIQLACMFLFIYTAYSKITGHDRFERALDRVDIVGDYSPFVSWLIPLSELAVAAMLMIPNTARIGLQAFAGLMGIFSFYIIYELIWSSRIPCHCGGIIESLSWQQHLWFNFGFIGIALTGLFIEKNINLKN